MTAETPDHRLTIVVPATPGALPGIASRSAIVAVGQPRDGSVLIHFEGGIYGQQGFERFAVRLMHAAGRAHTRYPTLAMMGAPERALKPVGTYDPDRLAVTEISDAPALEAWAGESAEEIQGTIVEEGVHAWRSPEIAAVAAQLSPAGKDDGGRRISMRSRAGQLFTFDAVRLEVTVSAFRRSAQA